MAIIDRPVRACVALIVVSLGLRAGVALACVVGTGSGTCTESTLNACLPGGGSFDGSVTFNCGGATTITVTSTKTISADTTIDGAGLITISGGNSVGVFLVANAVNFTVQNLTIANGNNAFGGGGIYNNNGTLTVTNSTFSGNSAGSEGGGIFNSFGTLTVTDSTFSGNSASSFQGGGIFNGGTLTVTNSTFSGNSAPNTSVGDGEGAGIFNNNTLTVTNSTFSGNSAGYEGGGIFNNGNTVTVTNTIVANSISGGNCAGAAVTDGGHNIDDGTTCGFTGTGCITTSGSSFCGTNPQLDPAGLANNGGPTQTIAIQASSAAVDGGDETVCSMTTGTAPVNNLDQRGYVRPGLGATTCSIGAYEFNSCPQMPANTCLSASKSSLQLKGNVDPTKRKFSWKWNKGTLPLVQADFGDPVSGSTSYQLCVYDETGDSPIFKMGTTVAPDGTCGNKPCWKAVSDKGWGYKNKTGNADGITKLSLKGGAAGKPKVQVKGAGASLPLPTPISGTVFFDQDTAVIVQIYSSSSMNCWSSTFDASSTKANSGTQFKAVTP